MTDKQAAYVRQCVLNYLTTYRLDPVDLARDGSFNNLVSDVLPRVLAIWPMADQAEVVDVIAMSLLGPGALATPPVGPPPDWLRAVMHQLVQRFPGGRMQVLRIACGLGGGKRDWWPWPLPDPAGWLPPWPVAVSLLARWIQPELNSLDRQIRAHVTGAADPFRHNPDGQWAVAGILAKQLVDPEWLLVLGPTDSLSIQCTPGSTLVQGPGAYVADVPAGAKLVASNKSRHALSFTGDTISPLEVLPGARVIVSADDQSAEVAAADPPPASRPTGRGRRHERTLGLFETVSVAGPTVLAIWSCTCGHYLCRFRHRLDGWEPPADLGAFVRLAARGET